MGVQRHVQMPNVWDRDGSSQDGSQAVQVSMQGYEVEILQCQHEYDRGLMNDPLHANGVIQKMRAEMVHQLAEEIYKYVEFQDFFKPETLSVTMRGRIQILRRDDD